MLKHRNEGNAIIVVLLTKRLDAESVPHFKLNMLELIEKGHKNIVLDLSTVGFMDSRGLGAIVSIYKLIGKDGNFVLSSLQDSVAVLFKLTRMDKVFPIYSNTTEAAATL
ncbi:MAG: STAS domain-containing protein [Gallionella sp.]